jgi:hypothetical protein
VFRYALDVFLTVLSYDREFRIEMEAKVPLIPEHEAFGGKEAKMIKKNECS